MKNIFDKFIREIIIHLAIQVRIGAAVMHGSGTGVKDKFIDTKPFFVNRFSKIEKRWKLQKVNRTGTSDVDFRENKNNMRSKSSFSQHLEMSDISYISR